MILVTALVGCRASREVNTSQQQYQSSNVNVEAHRLDSLWSLLIERYHVHFEFFNPNELQDNIPESLATESNGFPGLCPINQATQQGTVPRVGQSSDCLVPSPNGVGWLGAVKSIDIEAERTQSEQSLSHTDSTAICKTESESDAHTEKASEVRQDNGTWLIVSVVAAVAFIVLVLILIRKFFKK